MLGNMVSLGPCAFPPWKLSRGHQGPARLLSNGGPTRTTYQNRSVHTLSPELKEHPQAQLTHCDGRSIRCVLGGPVITMLTAPSMGHSRTHSFLQILPSPQLKTPASSLGPHSALRNYLCPLGSPPHPVRGEKSTLLPWA